MSAKPYDGPAVDIAVIGGSGLYDLPQFILKKSVSIMTPFGAPSSPIRIFSAALDGPDASPIHVAFVARHGDGHVLTPSEVPYAANIHALKQMGVKVILAFSAVGSLQEDIEPCDFVIPDQIIDRTKGIRCDSFFGNGMVTHASFADPFNAELAKMLLSHAQVLQGVLMHEKGTVLCMEGPAFSTRAESKLYRSWGASVINMTAVPEAKLAREAEILYQSICMATDYDSWKEGEHVTVEQVMKNVVVNVENAKRLMVAVLPELQAKINNNQLASLTAIKGSMMGACMTSKAKRDPAAVARVESILPGYY